MNDLNNDEVRLFDNGKKLTFSDCPESSLDGIGSDLLSDDFLKDDNGMSRSEGAGNFSDPLLIINNELSSQRQITLDDVVDLDLSSLSTLENNGISQHPQESLGFSDFLSEGSFCLNGLSEKLSEPDKQLGFENFGDIANDRNFCKIQGKEFKIVPTYVDGKLTNTLHLEDHISNPDKIFPEVSSASAVLTVPEVCPVTSASEKITATIEDFPSIAMVSGNTLTLNGQVQATLPSEVEPDISDLIKVKPREPKKIKKKPTKTSLAYVKKKKQKKRDRQNHASSEKISSKVTPSSDPLKKKLPLASAASKLTPSEPQQKNGIPKFKIVQQTEPTMSCDTSPIVSTSKFSNGAVFLPPTAPSAAASVMTILATGATKTIPSQPTEFILPVVPVQSDSNSKATLKTITDIKPGDAPIGNQGLSQMQKQQIAVILKQREALKRATGSSSNGPKRNENKIICKVFCPEDFFEAKQSSGSTKGDAAKDETSAKGSEDPKSDENPPKSKKPKILKSKQPHINEEFEADLPLALSVTRSGRTSRPPKKLVKREGKPTSTMKEKPKEDEPKQPTLSATSSAEGADVAKPKPELLEGLPTKKKLPKKPSNNHICPTCGKTYVDTKVYLKHLEAFPSHSASDDLGPPKPPPPPPPPPPPVSTASVRPKRKCRCKCKTSENCRARSLSLKQIVDTISEREFVKTCGPKFVKTTSVWDFLLLRIKTIYKYEDYVKGVLSELVKLWDSLKAVSSKILFPCDHPSETTVTIEDNATCEVLGVSKGVYQTFPSGLETPPPSLTSDYQGEPDPSLQSTVPPPDTKEDVSQSSLLSDILCDKAGMDTVDQLVSERLKTLAPGDDILDPPSDDLMTSLLNCHSNSLTDSMFNPLVSGSNDDLLKALENLANPIPPPLDFTALTNDYPDR